MCIRFETSKVKLLLGAVLAVLCPLSCWALGYSIKAGLVLMVAAAAVTVLKLEVPNLRVLKVLYATVFLASPCVCFMLGQLMQNIEMEHITVLKCCLNLLIILTLQLIVLLLSSNLRFAMILGQFLPLTLILANTYVYAFRGNAMVPTDLLSVQTAANVSAEYDFTPTAPMLYAVMISAIFALALYSLPFQCVKRNVRNFLAHTCCTLACILCLSVGCVNVTPRNWQNYGALYNGYLLNFTLQIKNIFVSQPEGYSAELIGEIDALYPQKDASVSMPDIIVIMDESFADFRVFDRHDLVGDEIMPYIDSLGEDTIRGYLTSSVFGGSTANSEYEFLSGNTMAFLPQGSIIYQQYYSEDSWSLVSYLNDCGYDCVAMHPYFASGWMRPTVYPQMGFQKMHFLDDFPKKQMIREYVSDREMFEYIVEYHEQHNADTPIFLFGITMQNHGGYDYKGADFQPTVSVEGYPMAEQYLTVAQESDRAVEFLIEHYKNVERDTVIVFFGDHMPNLEPDFYEELNGGAFDTLEDQMKKQMVPFFVWANFDIEERQIPCSSINYLPLYTLEAAGISLPPYMQFLKDTESVIPAINAYGYYSLEKQGFLPLEDATGVEAEAIRRYEALQYNNIFDDKNRNEHFFGK